VRFKLYSREVVGDIPWVGGRRWEGSHSIGYAGITLMVERRKEGEALRI
jgi:hypothetical protein